MHDAAGAARRPAVRSPPMRLVIDSLVGLMLLAILAGVVVFKPPRVDPRDLFNSLYSDHDIAGAAMGGDFTGVRLSPHIYNTMAQVERAVEVVTKLG